MEIVDSTRVAWRDPGTKHREGSILFKYLLRGTEGSPQNYEFSIVKTTGRFFGPPHRHNFDQVRYVLSGAFGKDDELRPGQVGYYPEGTPYQIDSGDAEVLLLQFGGSSGHGFMHYEQLRQAHPRLAQSGVFEGGIYIRRDPSTGRQVKQDGYEAIWEFVNGKKVVYPRPRYRQPVIMNPDNFPWQAEVDAVAGSDGDRGTQARQRLLGAFTERNTRIAMTRLPAGGSAAMRAGETVRLSYVTQGKGTVDGREIGQGTALRLEQGEAADVHASEDLQTIDIYLPRF